MHASDGTRIGCGIIESTPGEVVPLGRYPDLAQTIGYNVSGTFLVSDADSGGINITGTMGGLQASVSGGLHVHSGYTCSNDIYDDLYSVSVGGHYYDGMASDPWDTMYVSDSDGYWHNTIHVSTFTVEDAFPVAYRTLVVHMSASAGKTRIGCGVIGVPDTAVSEVGAYPGYSGALSVRGTVSIRGNQLGEGIILEGTIVGLEADVTGGIHIHSGVTCANESYVGGHYYDTDWASGDPWSTTYTSDENGVATVYIEMDDYFTCLL